VDLERSAVSGFMQLTLTFSDESSGGVSVGRWAYPLQPRAAMTVAYIAETRDYVLMLDDQGVCREVHRRLTGDKVSSSEKAAQCIGAQYVAALDPNTPGFLAHKPTVGVPMLFARVSSTGKISIVRTSPLERFESRESGLRERPKSTRNVLEEAAPSEPATIRYLARDDGSDEEPTHRLRKPAARPTIPAIRAKSRPLWVA
jgi:hypothetical protein